MVSKKQRGVGRVRGSARGGVQRGFSAFTQAMWGMPQTADITPASTGCATHCSPILTPPSPHTSQAIWWMLQTSTPASTPWATPPPTHCSAPCQHQQGHQLSPPSGPSQRLPRSTPQPRLPPSTPHSQVPPSTLHRWAAPSIRVLHPLLGALPPLPLLLPLAGPPLPPLPLPLEHPREARRRR